jgi:5-methyltetrahydropteroyltriglutamate--homocysteine methyltransferase
MGVAFRQNSRHALAKPLPPPFRWPLTAPPALPEFIIAPDCGMKYLPRDIAFGKMRAMVDGAKIVRAEAGGLASPHLQ